MNNRTSDYQNQNKSGKKSMKLKITGFTVQNDYKSPVREIIGAQNISSNKSNVKIKRVERDHRKSTEKLHNTV